MQLVDYKEKHGDCRVPSRYEENIRLGKWVETQVSIVTESLFRKFLLLTLASHYATQRYEYTKLNRSSQNTFTEKSPKEKQQDDTKSNSVISRLTPVRLTQLEAIGFEWRVEHKMKRFYKKKWDGMFDQLCEYQKTHGDTNVPKTYPLNPKL